MNTRTVISFLCAVLLAGLCGTSAFAQDGHLDAGFGFQMGFPSGEFKDALDRNGYGIGAHIGYAFPDNVPVMLGLNFAYMTYGSETRQEPFSSTVPDVKVRVERDYNIVQGHLQLRIGPNTGMIRPYLDGLLGFNYLYTNTAIQNQGNANEEVASSVNMDDFTLSLGGGGGLMVRVYDGRDERAEQIKAGKNGDGILEALIHLQVHYLAGSEAEYLKPGSVKIDSNRQVTYDITKSRTDMIVGRVGVTLIF
jgi:hypothetical protein